jgi:hypothetical protein
VEHQGFVSNEAEFEYWLVSAFESERKRLQERAAAAVRSHEPLLKPHIISGSKVTSITRGKNHPGAK